MNESLGAMRIRWRMLEYCLNINIKGRADYGYQIITKVPHFTTSLFDLEGQVTISEHRVLCFISWLSSLAAPRSLCSTLQ